MNADHDDNDITLPLLQCIEANRAVTQRGLSKSLGTALGVTNTYLKHCIRKGLVKIEQIPANRYLYYLTPKGFAEKSRLTAKYLSKSFRFYRKVNDACQQICRYCEQQRWNQVVLCGVSDLAELAMLIFEREGIRVIGLFDEEFEFDEFQGYPIWRDLSELPAQGVFVVTTLHLTTTLKQQLFALTDKTRVIIPDILSV